MIGKTSSWKRPVQTEVVPENRTSCRGGHDADVVYRWQPWFGRTVRVGEVIERGDVPVARCLPLDGSFGAVLEVRAWMLDAGVCKAMRPASDPVASVAALSDLRGLRSDRLAGGDIDAEASGDAGVGFADHQMGDCHPTSVATRGATAATGPVRSGRTVPPAGRAVLDGPACGNADGVDGSTDPDADRACAGQGIRAGGGR